MGLFAALTQVVARSAVAGLEGAYNGSAPSSSARSDTPGCTPCAAMARRERAAAFVRGEPAAPAPKARKAARR